ncbi:MAG: HAD family hydrolase, partial [Nocardioides sp.]
MTSRAALAALLLDFDGPLTDLMPYPVNQDAADQARGALNRLAELPEPLRVTADHLAILRYVDRYQPAQLADVLTACVQAEVAAARHSTPSPHAEDLFDFAARRQVPVAVVSNNDARAVRAFLDRFGWSERVRHYACRTSQRVSAMKPAPDLLDAVVTALDTE